MSSPTASPEPLPRPAVAAAEAQLPVHPSRPRHRPRGPSVLVRETTTLQLEARRTHWGYSKPMVALDVAWTLAFAVAATAVLASTFREGPNIPIGLWVAGYALQCVVHTGVVWAEHRRRSGQWRGVEDGGRAASDSEGNVYLHTSKNPLCVYSG